MEGKKIYATFTGKRLFSIITQPRDISSRPANSYTTCQLGLLRRSKLLDLNLQMFKQNFVRVLFVKQTNQTLTYFGARYVKKPSSKDPKHRETTLKIKLLELSLVKSFFQLGSRTIQANPE